MKILVGSLGRLGYLVKPLPAESGAPAWLRFEDEAALLDHLRDMNFPDPVIRSVFRSIRAEGRAVVSNGAADTGAPAARRMTALRPPATRPAGS